MKQKTRLAHITRRDLLKLAGLGLGSITINPLTKLLPIQEFPASDRLGRICRPMSSADLKRKPSYDSPTVKVLYEDTILPWLKEVPGYHPARNNQRYVETPEGYIWSADLLPVRNFPNKPIDSLPKIPQGQGLWVEVTIPYVDVVLDNPPARSPYLRNGALPRFYYSQVLWVDQMKTDVNGQIWYRINERYGTYGDIFWGQAEGFRPIKSEEMTPINPEMEEKRIIIDVDWKRQTLSCYEGKTEVYFCLISSGREQGATPLGKHSIWRKLVSVHMSGGTTGGGYDLPGIGWTTLFVGDGVAIHSTFWHNNFGEPESHGCVNARPEDAQWIFRWTLPTVSYEPGDKTISGSGSTKVKIIEAGY